VDPCEVEISGDEAIVPGNSDNQGNGVGQQDKDKKMDQSQTSDETMIRARDRIYQLLHSGDARR